MKHTLGKPTRFAYLSQTKFIHVKNTPYTLRQIILLHTSFSLYILILKNTQPATQS